MYLGQKKFIFKFLPVINKMNEEPYQRLQCTIEGCYRLFTSKYNLKRHIESCHDGVRKHECGICFKRFSSRHNREEHIKLEHSYSWSSNDEIKAGIPTEDYNFEVPKLTFLTRRCKDPHLRPFSKIEKIYMTVKQKKDKKLPHICEKRQVIQDLPKLESLV